MKKIAYSLLILILYLVCINAYENLDEIRLLPKPLPSLLLQTKFKPITLDKIYVIALDRKPDRYAKVKEQFDKIGIELTKFTATDGYDMEIIGKNNTHFHGKDIKSGAVQFNFGEEYKILCPTLSFTYIPTGRIYGAGALGCECSHREVWNSMIKNNVKYAMILEDDASIHQTKFLDQLNKLLKNTPAHWDLILLQVSPDSHLTPWIKYKKYTTIVNNFSLVKIEPMPIGMHGAVGYIVNLDSAKILLEHGKFMSFDTVDMYFQSLINNGIIKAYKPKKDIIYHTGELPSSITEMGRLIEAK